MAKTVGLLSDRSAVQEEKERREQQQQRERERERGGGEKEEKRRKEKRKGEEGEDSLVPHPVNRNFKTAEYATSVGAGHNGVVATTAAVNQPEIPQRFYSKPFHLPCLNAWALPCLALVN